MKIIPGSMLIMLLILSSAYPQEKREKFKRFEISLSMGKLYRQFEDMDRIYHRRLVIGDRVFPNWYYAKYEDPVFYEGRIFYGLSEKNRILLGAIRLQKDIYGSVEVPPYKDYFDRFRLMGVFAGYARTLITYRSLYLMSQISAGYYRSEKQDKYRYYGDSAEVSASTLGTDITFKLQWKWNVVKNSSWYIGAGYRHLDFGTYTGNYNGKEVTLVGIEEIHGSYNYMYEHLKELFDQSGMEYWDIEIDYSGFHIDFGVSYFF